MKMKKLFVFLLPVFAIAGLILFNACKNADTKNTGTMADSTNTGAAPTAANAGLTLPAGFSAAAIAENLSSPRHLVVTPQNDIYVHLSGSNNGKGILVLHDDGDKATLKTGFANYGGTGITIKNGYLYASSNSDIYRYKLNDKNEVIDPAKPETIVSGLTNKRMHNSKSIVLDNDGNIYVNIGAYSNICDDYDKDKKGCPVLADAAGIWQFKADKLNQKQSDGVRYATGLRNVVGLDWNQQDNQLFVMQHGRDALHDLYPNLYTAKQSADLPAECMFALKNGDNAGWPYLYYDWMQHKKMLGPEYGGDGKKEADSKYLEPAAAYPGHFAPDGLLFYTGNQFPEKYKNGAFIAFHGSWNRAPEPQEGYCVVFQPFKDGKPDGKYEIFADGFAGPNKSPDGALHRPCGLAQGPDGSLYVTDDQKGTIYKITYKK
ncbi:PQQ-dependent sugar dehydrogenase [Mucilaginibacter sp. OK098]|uniref:PQQ-dependent sugar dehydrogenase n=1 Tax=Mucilaginibacter sp. OK098 TaxID=1855297 RepID=UPI00091A894E|nr:PQQ-dependent sugar dehydrogenase [Mucilaginibacter sp. OK098]SHM10527.1 Glucose/arabinose dehydrogenase, beta-propeller fold [Mucilaginibacter sp. OK098]